MLEQINIQLISAKKYQTQIILQNQNLFIKQKQKHKQIVLLQKFGFNILGQMQDFLYLLGTIIGRYSQLPLLEVFEAYLSVSILTFSNKQIALSYLIKELNLPQQKIGLFFKNHLKQCLKSRRQFYIYISISHQRLMSIKQIFKASFQQINTEVICVLKKPLVYELKTEDQQNFGKQFYVDNFCLQHDATCRLSYQNKVNGFFISIPFHQFKIQYFKEQISLFLSINELFHSHINLVLRTFEIQSFEQMIKIIKLSKNIFYEDDDDQLMNYAKFIRIFNGIMRKIDKTQIKQLGDLQLYEWGQLIRIRQGTQGIIFWFLQNSLPIIDSQGTAPQLKIYQKMLKLRECQYGHMIFTLKKLAGTPIQQVDFTLVIFNFWKGKASNYKYVFGQRFERQIKYFYAAKRQSAEIKNCEQLETDLERLSKLLQTDHQSILNWLLYEDRKNIKTNETNGTIKNKKQDTSLNIKNNECQINKCQQGKIFQQKIIFQTIQQKKTIAKKRNIPTSKREKEVPRRKKNKNQLKFLATFFRQMDSSDSQSY